MMSLIACSDREYTNYTEVGSVCPLMIFSFLMMRQVVLYDLMARYLARGTPVYTVLGNHDTYNEYVPFLSTYLARSPLQGHALAQHAPLPADEPICLVRARLSRAITPRPR